MIHRPWAVVAHALDVEKFLHNPDEILMILLEDDFTERNNDNLPY